MAKKTCNGCPFCRVELEEGFSDASGLTYYSYFCEKLKGFIDYYVLASEEVDAPENCPEKNKIKKQKEEWLKLPTLTLWDEIKEGEIYHLPPLNGKPRMDVRVTFKSDYSCTVRVLNDIPNLNSSRLITWYPRDWEYKFLTQHRLIKIKECQSPTQKRLDF